MRTLRLCFDADLYKEPREKVLLLYLPENKQIPRPPVRIETHPSRGFGAFHPYADCRIFSYPIRHQGDFEGSQRKGTVASGKLHQ